MECLGRPPANLTPERGSPKLDQFRRAHLAQLSQRLSVRLSAPFHMSRECSEYKHGPLGILESLSPCLCCKNCTPNTEHPRQKPASTTASSTASTSAVLIERDGMVSIAEKKILKHLTLCHVFLLRSVEFCRLRNWLRTQPAEPRAVAAGALGPQRPGRVLSIRWIVWARSGPPKNPAKVDKTIKAKLLKRFKKTGWCLVPSSEWSSWAP